MKPIQIDADLVKKLQEAGNEATLVGPDGQSAGVFLSLEERELFRALMQELRHYQTPTPEQLRRSLENPKKHTMEEVLRMVEGR